MSQYLNLIAGATRFDQQSQGVVGIGYSLPMRIEAELLVDSKGEIRLDLEKRFQWTRHLLTGAEVSFRLNHKTESKVSLMYAPSWSWAAGLVLTEDSLGVGGRYRF